MEELRFTWVSVAKIFAAILILGVWFTVRSQAEAEKRNGSVVSRSSIFMAIAAILFLVIVLLWGNASTI